MAKIEMPSSSINSAGEPPKKQLKKVTTGKVTIKQESEIQKLAHNFLAEDLQTIREKLWTDYILPGIKNMVCSAVNIALFGVDRSRTNTGGYSQQRNSYSSYYANANQSRPPQNNYRPNRLDWQNGKMQEIPGSEFELKADLVFLAMGFVGPEREGLLTELGVELTDRGNVARDNDFQTTVPGVFVAGDMGRGQSLIVWAIAEGRAAAHGVDAWLTGGSTLPRPIAPTDRPLTV